MPVTRAAPIASARPVPWNGTIPRTRFFDALSLMLPAGETFVIATLEQWRAEAGHALDAATRAEVDRFVREERAHQRAHHLYNRALLAETPAASAPAGRAERAAAELQSLGLLEKLALAAAFEQLTAVLSHEVLAHPHLLPHAGAPSSQARLWRWHAAEELGHCHVATQAAARAGVRGLRRVAALGLATAYLGFDALRCWLALCRCDIAAGASWRTVAVDAAGFATRSVPSLLRMSLGWLRCLMTPHRIEPRA
jgi:predicted metal-dependent hydrolase